MTCICRVMHLWWMPPSSWLWPPGLVPMTHPMAKVSPLLLSLWTSSSLPWSLYRRDAASAVLFRLGKVISGFKHKCLLPFQEDMGMTCCLDNGSPLLVKLRACRTPPASFDLRGFATTLSFNGEPSGNVFFRHSSAQPIGSEGLRSFPRESPSSTVWVLVLLLFQGYKPKFQEEHRAIVTHMVKGSKKTRTRCLYFAFGPENVEQQNPWVV